MKINNHEGKTGQQAMLLYVKTDNKLVLNGANIK